MLPLPSAKDTVELELQADGGAVTARRLVNETWTCTAQLGRMDTRNGRGRTRVMTAWWKGRVATRWQCGSERVYIPIKNELRKHENNARIANENREKKELKN